MLGDKIIEFADSELSKDLGYFVGIYEDEAEELMRTTCKAGYSHILREKSDHLEAYLASNPDPIWIRDFVEIEMNQSLDDPTGQAHFHWLEDALGRMKKVLAEYEAGSLK